MTNTITAFLLMTTFLGTAAGATAADAEADADSNLAIGQELRAAAEHGDAEAMIRLALHLDKYAPAKNDAADLCGGEKVNPSARENLEVRDHDCNSARIPGQQELMEKWRRIGYRSDFDYWANRAAKLADANTLAIFCAREENPSAQLKAFCARIGGSIDKLKASAFTRCALITETVARLLLDQGKNRDAIDYYRNATNDYLAGARKLATPDEFRMIFGEETGKLREKIQRNEGDALEPIVQTARKCAQALEGVP